jgi:hypothetical protein
MDIDPISLARITTASASHDGFSRPPMMPERIVLFSLPPLCLCVFAPLRDPFLKAFPHATRAGAPEGGVVGSRIIPDSASLHPGYERHHLPGPLRALRFSAPLRDSSMNASNRGT